jgi:heat shock protein HtpX
MILVESDECPECSQVMVRVERGLPWCPAYEWNLSVYDPAALPPRGWGWLERSGHRLATRLDQELLAELSGATPTRPGWTRAHRWLVVISAFLLLGIASALLIGVWLIVKHSSLANTAVGVLLVGSALFLRPRLGHRPRRLRCITAAHFPALLTLIEKVAAEVGTAPPDYVTLDYGYNASVERVGLRGRTVLRIGILMWVTIAPQARVALLAHELGHTVNGDPNRGLVTQPAMATFGRLADLTGAYRTLGDVFDPDRMRELPVLLAEVALWIISRPFLLIHLALAAVALRDHQRAEYLADSIAADIAGTAAAVSLSDQMLYSDTAMDIVGYGAETERPTTWHASIASYISQDAAQLAHWRQFSRRRTSLWDSHPPVGLRSLLLEARAPREARFVMSKPTETKINAELAGWYAALHADVLGTRDFRESPATPKSLAAPGS